ncbi:MAG: TonB-dependent receptor, partial [Niabella sp.]
IDFDAFWAARTSNLYDPIYTPTPDTGKGIVALKNFNDTKLTSYSLADTLAFFDDKLKVTLGARHQTVEAQAYNFSTGQPSGSKYDQSETTPVAAIVFQPRTGLSFYANYVEGLSQGPSAPVGTVNYGTVFPPIKTKQYEIGTKADWGRIATTLSLFQITRPSGFVSGNVYAMNGEQRNRGAEFNVFGEIVRDVRLLGGIVFLDGKLTKTAGGKLDGKDAIGVPPIQANLGVDWDNSLAPGLGLNARVVYTDAQYADQANQLRLSAWTRFDIGASYKTRIGGKATTLRASVENVFDSDYWATSNEGYLFIGTPRTILVSATVDF